MAHKNLKLSNVKPTNQKRIVFGISSHENDYRISWAINKALNFNFVKTNDFEINKETAFYKKFPVYTFVDEHSFFIYKLIANSSEKGFLIGKLSTIDYFLTITGEAGFIDTTNFLNRLKKTNIILAVYIIPYQKNKALRVLFDL